MARSKNLKVIGIKSSTLANFEGSFGAIIGLGIAIIHSLNTTVDVASETQSVLSGLAFGLAAGLVSVIVLPLIYFGLGWIVGYIHGFIFNVVAETSGGLVVKTED